MPRHATLLVSIALSTALFTNACGDGDEDPQSANDPGTGGAVTTSTLQAPTTAATQAAELDATAVAEEITQSTTKSVASITEDNDPNDLIGRPNGYLSAAVLYDSNASCTELGVSCGATVEVWPDEAAAKARSDYIQSILKDSPVLGSEFHTLNGSILLRVDGKQLKPSDAKLYAEALSQ